jgi:hypothetical protein
VIRSDKATHEIKMSSIIVIAFVSTITRYWTCNVRHDARYSVCLSCCLYDIIDLMQRPHRPFFGLGREKSSS